MSTRVIGAIFILVVGALGVLIFTGTANQAEAPMEDTMVHKDDGTHVMPDGTIMSNTEAGTHGSHVMPDGTVMQN
jgi:hypothetical protein